jgi:predicted transcriptional regulator
MALTYRQRRREGLITRHQPPRVPNHIRQAIGRRYFAREKTQLELALEHGCSQPTIARIVANWEFYESGSVPPKLQTASDGEDRRSAIVRAGHSQVAITNPARPSLFE